MLFGVLMVQARWLEVSSCSNFEGFQARRAQIRFRDEQHLFQIAEACIQKIDPETGRRVLVRLNVWVNVAWLLSGCPMVSTLM